MEYNDEEVTELEFKKYAVIKLDCVEHNCEILAVFCDIRDALKYYNDCLECEDSDPVWYRREMDGDFTTSIYKLNIFTSKTLLSKYLIKCYSDTN